MTKAASLSFVLLALLAAPALAQITPDGADFEVNSTCPELAYPGAAMNGSGAFIVAWHSYSNGIPDYEILARRFSSTGQPLGGVIRVSQNYPGDLNPGQHDVRPRIGMDDTGAFSIVWPSRDQRPGDNRVVAGRSFDASGTPLSDDLLVSDPNPGFLPALAMNGSGDLVVIWGASDEVVGRRFAALDNPLGSEMHLASSRWSVAAALAMDAQGGFVVVWHDLTDDVIHLLRGQRFDETGQPIGTPFDIATLQGLTGRPDIALGGPDRIIVSWLDCPELNLPIRNPNRRADCYRVFARVLDGAGHPLSDVFQVNANDPGENFRVGPPSVRANEEGDFLIAWKSKFSDMFARAYESSGVSRGDDVFLGESEPIAGWGEIAMDSGNRFVAVRQNWDAIGHSGCGYTTIARRFTASFDCDRQGDPAGRCDIRITSPTGGQSVDCGGESAPPLIEWIPGRYDRFDVHISWTEDFSNFARSETVRESSWQPPPGQWQQACDRAGGRLFVRVLGKDDDPSLDGTSVGISSPIVAIDTR